MLSALVLASSSNTLKYHSYFRSLGMEISYLIINQSQIAVFAPLDEQYLLSGPLMTKIKSEQKVIKWFNRKIERYIYPDRFFSRSLLSKTMIKQKFQLQNFIDPVDVIHSKDVLDLKMNAKKKINLELQNQAVRTFDHLFVESSESSVKFLQTLGFNQFQYEKPDDLVWQCFQFTCSQNLADDDFWCLDSTNYDSLFDNLFFIQPKKEKLFVWAVVPDHQKLNNQFLIEFQNRIKNKIERRLQFLTLSSQGVFEDAVDLGSCINKKLKHLKFVSEFPNFYMFSEKRTFDFFSLLQQKISKVHKA